MKTFLLIALLALPLTGLAATGISSGDTGIFTTTPPVPEAPLHGSPTPAPVTAGISVSDPVKITEATLVDAKEDSATRGGFTVPEPAVALLGGLGVLILLLRRK